MQSFVVLRGAIFAERGFNLKLSDAVPDGRLRPDTAAMFCMRDANGATTGFEPIDGCAGLSSDTVRVVNLAPYPDSGEFKAADVVELMANKLQDAIAGDTEAKAALGRAWQYLVGTSIGLASGEGKQQMALLENLFGAGRVYAALNRTGTVAGLKMPDPVQMVDEAFDLVPSALA